MTTIVKQAQNTLHIDTLRSIRAAFVEYNTDMIDYQFKQNPNIMDVTQDVTYNKGKSTIQITAWSLIKRGRAHNNVLPYLLKKRHIYIDQNLVELLAQMISFSGSYTHSEKENSNMIHQIDFLINYIGVIEPHLLINYRDPYGLTLLHIIFYGHALNVDRERWFDLLMYHGINPLTKSYPENGSAKSNVNPFGAEAGGQFGLQTVLELAAHNLNYNVLVKCIALGADVNEFEYDNSRNGRNILQEILFTYSDKESQEDVAARSIIDNIIYLLIFNGIDLTYDDNSGNNVMYYMEKYGWTKNVSTTSPSIIN